MKLLLAFCVFFIATLYPADASNVKLGDLPIGNASTVNNADSFPITNSLAGVTQRILFGDLTNLPQLSGAFAPINSPVFTGTVTAPDIYITGNLGIGVVATHPFQLSESNTNYVAIIQNTNTTAGTSFALQVEGGTNSSDAALNVLSASASPLFKVLGNGTISVPALSASLPVQTDGSSNLTTGAINLSGSQVTGSLAAARMPGLTGDVTSSAGTVSTTIAAGVVTNSKLTTMAGNTVKANISGTTASPSDVPLGSLTDSGTDGITVTGGTNATVQNVSLSQQVADTTHNGYLSSTDWNTFNGKQSSFSFGTFGSTPNPNGGSTSSSVITLQPADGTNPGGVSTTIQTFAGAKTFSVSATSPAFVSSTASPATAGTLEMADTDTIDWRNHAGSANIALGKNASDQLTYAGNAVLSSSGILLSSAFSGTTGTGNVVFSASPTLTGTSIIPIINSGSSTPFTLQSNGTTALTADTSQNINIPKLTASLPVQTDASKNLISSAIDLSSSQSTGTLAAGRFPALTGDVTTTAGSLSTTVSKIAGTTVTGTTGTGNLVFSSLPTFGGAIAAPVLNSSAASLTLESLGLTGLTIDTSQNVTIPNKLNIGSPGFTAFDVNIGNGGTISISDGSNGGFIGTFSSGTTSAGFLTIGHAAAFTSNGDTALVNETATGKLYLGTNTTPALTIDASQNSTFAGTMKMPNIGTSTAALDFLCWNPSTGAITGDGSGTCLASTIKVKEDVKDLNIGLKELMKLRPVSFDYKKKYSPRNLGNQIGFIAEEVNEIDHRLVTKDDNGELNGVRYSQMVSLLTKAIQQQQKQIEDQNKQIQKLMGEQCLSVK